MRKKISIGFIALALLLLFAGAISMFEIKRLKMEAGIVNELTDQNAKFADKMLSGLQMQNSSILKVIYHRDIIAPDTEYDKGRTTFDESYTAAAKASSNRSDLIALHEENLNYHRVISDYLDEKNTLTETEFLPIYLNAYYKLDKSIKEYQTLPTNSIPSIEQDVYRTITPSILTLLIAIIVVLMFYYFITSFYINPLTKIHKSLSNYLSHKIPFDPRFESNDDELNGLRQMISQLIERKKV